MRLLAAVALAVLLGMWACTRHDRRQLREDLREAVAGIEEEIRGAAKELRDEAHRLRDRVREKARHRHQESMN